ncbi:ABC transporter permease [Streptacidiphilus sp. 4-A2]|nr:ABC transporter permease [Streptacidiphilus sp. 4-A2]
MKLTAWRAALRIARRDALRAKGRSALVIAMIAIPVLGVAAADVTYRSSELTVQERATRTMGTADAFVQIGSQAGWRVEQAPNPFGGATYTPADGGNSPSPTALEKSRAAEPLARLLQQALPAGARLLPLEQARLLPTSTANGVLPALIQGFDLADPLTHGMVDLDQGRWPTGPGQVAASTAFLKDSGLRIGRTTTPAGTSTPLTITAAVEFPGDLNDDQLVLWPTDLATVLAAQNTGTTGPAQPAGPPMGWLLAMPGHSGFSWDDVLKANQWGFVITSRAVLQDPPPDSAVPLDQDPGYHNLGRSSDPVATAVLATVVGMALLEIVLLAGPAFAVGARRSRRQLGLIAAGGGDRAHIRAVVLGSGVVLGLTGAVTGIVVGAIAVALGRGELESLSGARFGGYSLRPVDLLGIMLVGLVTGLLAAVVPAVQASRQDVMTSLTGRGIVKAPPAWLTVLGALAVAGGTAVALLGVGTGRGSMFILGGSILAELGAVACTPFLVGLFGRLGRLLPLGPRLALRDSTRNRGRTAPAVAAVMAAVAGAVAVSVYQSSSDTASRAQYQPSGAIGSVMLQYQSSDTPARMAAEAGAVQNSADLGPRGDLDRLYYQHDCDAPDMATCGTVTVAFPAALHCPGSANGSAQGTPVTGVQVLNKACASTMLNVGALDGENVIATGPAALPALLGGGLDPSAGQALAAGTALVTDPSLVTDGRVTLNLRLTDGTGGASPARTTTVSLPALVVNRPSAPVQAVLSPAAAVRAGLRTAPMAAVWLPSGASTAPSSSAWPPPSAGCPARPRCRWSADTRAPTVRSRSAWR